jgi:hypothetical protein
LQKSYCIARKEFEETNVEGIDIEMDKEKENYLRHFIQKRVVKCQSCFAIMWVAENRRIKC